MRSNFSQGFLPKGKKALGRLFCPSCGATDSLFVRGSCLQCFLKEHTLLQLPEKIELQRCKQCGKILLSGKMHAFDLELLKQFVKKKCKVKELTDAALSVELQRLSEKEMQAIVTAKGVIENTPVLVERKTTISFPAMQCDACMKLKSNYFEAIVQLRGEKAAAAFNRLRQLLASLQKRDGLAAIVSATQKKNSIDAIVGSKKAAALAVKQLEKEFKTDATKTFKLIGVDRTGKQKKRETFALRI